MSAWIETHRARLVAFQAPRRTLMSAWIETEISWLAYVGFQSHSHECVD